MQANTPKRGCGPSASSWFAWLLALPIALCSGTTADAQPVPGPLCCDSATMTCGAPALDAGAPTAKNSLGIVPRCPPPSPHAVMIEIPGAGATKNATVRVQTGEPPAGQGFVGACLAPNISYRPTLPSTCFWVKVAGTVTGITPVSPHSYAMVTAAAGMDSRVPFGGDKIFQPYSTSDTANPAPDSYEVLMTCYPRDATKACKDNCCDGCCSPSRLVSRSCCDLGARMTSLDGKYASGFASMPTFP